MPTQDTKDMSIVELFHALWRGKWLIIGTTITFAIGAVLFAISKPDIYMSDALISPSEQSSGGGLSQMAAQFGGIAALAGVNLGASESNQTDLAIQVMKSRKFIDNFIRKHNLLIPLVASKGWDASTNKLIIDDEVYDVKSNKWLRQPEGLLTSQPTPLEAFEVFTKSVFSIEENKETGLYVISVKHYSPEVAQQWVDWLIEDINQVMRERSIAETSKNLAYLKSQLSKTSVSEMQSTFYKLIEEQTKSLMLAEAQEEFVFKIVDPSIKPETPIEPKRILIVFFMISLGLMLSIVYILLRNVLVRM